MILLFRGWDRWDGCFYCASLWPEYLPITLSWLSCNGMIIKIQLDGSHKTLTTPVCSKWGFQNFKTSRQKRNKVFWKSWGGARVYPRHIEEGRMDIDCLAHKRWITFLVLYQNGSRMTAAHNWKVLWTVMVWPWAVGWLCVFPLFVFAVFSSLTGSRLPTSGPVGVAAVSATAERRTCRPAALHLLRGR